MSSDSPDSAEHRGYKIGRQVVEQARSVANDQAAIHKLFTAGCVICASENNPREAFAGFATAVIPALREAPASEKAVITLAARAALAGHVCSIAEGGSISLSRWGRSMSFDDVATASAWLDKVTGQKGGA